MIGGQAFENIAEMPFGDRKRLVVIDEFPYMCKGNSSIPSIVGGITHYLKQFDPERTLDDNIKTNVLTRGCVLYSEVELLLKQELRETALYNALIDAIALGNTKLNEIRQKAKKDPMQDVGYISLQIISSDSDMHLFSVTTLNSRMGMLKEYINMRSNRTLSALPRRYLNLSANSSLS